MRKKILALGLALSTMMVCFTGCGEDEKAPLTRRATDESGMTVNEKYVFMASVPGTTATVPLIMGDPASVLEELGEPTSSFTATSCAFEGEDHIYTYGTSYQVTTSTVDGNEVITCVQLLDDMVETEEGIRIGSTNHDVFEKMNVDVNETGNYQFKDGKTELSIVVKDESVISITYSYVE